MSNRINRPDTQILITVGLLLLTLLCSSVVESGGKVNNEELYQLLGVSKQSTTREIRIAFKKLALEKHPDKNKDNPNANEEFIRINRAYEILKDDELRKKYDMFGEDGLKENQNQGHSYQSWNFYQQNFGIYDNDPEIQTLSRSDFMQAVDSTDTIWFINFYSTQCSHCHELAPTWRELAKQLDGVIKIGAVNCMDDWALCNEQQITSFPSLIMYPKRARFMETKTIEQLLKFALSFASGNVYDLSTVSRYESQMKKSETTTTTPYLITYCLNNKKNFAGRKDKDTNNSGEEEEDELNYDLNCLDELVQRKLAIMLYGLAKVAHIDCNKNEAEKKICPRLKPRWSAPIVLYTRRLPNITDDSSSMLDDSSPVEINTSDYKKIIQVVLTHLPDVPLIDEDRFKAIIEDLRQANGEENPWLIEFTNEYNPSETLEFKKLPVLLAPKYNFGVVECSKLTDKSLCQIKYQITKYPTFILFKAAKTIENGPVHMNDDNWYEIYYPSRVTVDDLGAFVKANAHSIVRTLTRLSADFIEEQLAAQQKRAYFVDFFAPWCPPCMNLLPEFRKASKLDGSPSQVLFATVDCSVNTRLCEQYGIRSYPTTILFNGTAPNTYHGFHRAQDISDFIDDVLKPVVVNLNYDMFYSIVSKKPVGKIWMIDWFANWCGPCQQLAPEWRKMAKRVDAQTISVGQVDCVVEQRLCTEQGVHSYPNIRIYPSSSYGVTRFEIYQGWMRDANSLLQWALNYMPSAAYILDNSNFEQLVLRNFHIDGEPNDLPWLIDFYAPWCGHCQVFAPTFESLAVKLKGRVKCGKVNCQEQQYLCQTLGIRAYPSIRFYPVSNSPKVDWHSGVDIQQYDFDSIMRTVNMKLNEYGYKSVGVGNEEMGAKSSFHTEL